MKIASFPPYQIYLNIDISTPEMGNVNIENEINDNRCHLEYLLGTQQDDLLRKFIINERSLIPAAKCSDCSLQQCRNCNILTSH